MESADEVSSSSSTTSRANKVYKKQAYVHSYEATKHINEINERLAKKKQREEREKKRVEQEELERKGIKRKKLNSPSTFKDPVVRQHLQHLEHYFEEIDNWSLEIETAPPPSAMKPPGSSMKPAGSAISASRTIPPTPSILRTQQPPDSIIKRALQAPGSVIKNANLTSAATGRASVVPSAQPPGSVIKNAQTASAIPSSKATDTSVLRNVTNLTSAAPSAASSVVSTGGKQKRGYQQNSPTIRHLLNGRVSTAPVRKSLRVSALGMPVANDTIHDDAVDLVADQMVNQAIDDLFRD